MKYISLLLVICTVILAGCSNESDSLSDGYSTGLQNEAPHETSNQGLGNTVSISENNQPIATLFLAGSPRIEFGSQKITSKIGSSGKRKYFDKNGVVLAKINNDRNGKIKLKSEQGGLIWKVKVKPDSIKIADNEEMNSAYKIKNKAADRVKLLANEVELGKALFVDGAVVITAPNLSINSSGAALDESAVLGFSGIPMVYRLIILSELSLQAGY